MIETRLRNYTELEESQKPRCVGPRDTVWFGRFSPTISYGRGFSSHGLTGREKARGFAAIDCLGRTT